VILGNDALVKCDIPSFVADLVQVSGWIDNEGKEFLPSTTNTFGNLGLTPSPSLRAQTHIPESFFSMISVYEPITRCSVIGTKGGGGLVMGTFPGGYIPGPRYRYIPLASLSVQCTNNKVCTDKFCTDSESDKEGIVICTVPITRPLCIQLLWLITFSSVSSQL